MWMVASGKREWPRVLTHELEFGDNVPTSQNSVTHVCVWACVCVSSLSSSSNVGSSVLHANETKRTWNSWIILWQKISRYQIKVPSYTFFNVLAYIHRAQNAVCRRKGQRTKKKVRKEPCCDCTALKAYGYGFVRASERARAPTIFRGNHYSQIIGRIV